MGRAHRKLKADLAGRGQLFVRGRTGIFARNRNLTSTDWGDHRWGGGRLVLHRTRMTARSRTAVRGQQR